MEDVGGVWWQKRPVIHHQVICAPKHDTPRPLSSGPLYLQCEGEVVKQVVLGGGGRGIGIMTTRVIIFSRVSQVFTHSSNMSHCFGYHAVV